jgi:Ca2+-binding RTX toxin-like protein
MAIAFGAIIENAFGGLGNDTLVGSGGANRLVGNAGNDTLDGGLGNDTIIGTNGQDQMWGGTGAIDTGADVFQFGAGNGYDIIFDFQAGAGVVDQISLIGFDLSNSGQMLSANLISQAGANTQINLPGSGNVIFLINTTATTLVADDVPLG